MTTLIAFITGLAIGIISGVMFATVMILEEKRKRGRIMGANREEMEMWNMYNSQLMKRFEDMEPIECISCKHSKQGKKCSRWKGVTLCEDWEVVESKEADND